MIETEVLLGARTALASLADVAYLEEGVQAEAPAGSDGAPRPWVRAHDVPAPPRRFGLSGPSVICSGLLQVDVMVPKSLGRDEARRLAALVAALFPLDSLLGRVRVSDPAYPSAPLDDPPHYRVPVTVPYRGCLREA